MMRSGIDHKVLERSESEENIISSAAIGGDVSLSDMESSNTSNRIHKTTEIHITREDSA
jgi:hypothetical protein